MRQHLHLLLPGFAELFKEFFVHHSARYLARQFEAPQAFRQLGVSGMTQLLDEAGIAYHRTTLAKIAACGSTRRSTTIGTLKPRKL